MLPARKEDLLTVNFLSVNIEIATDQSVRVKKTVRWVFEVLIFYIFIKKTNNKYFDFDFNNYGKSPSSAAGLRYKQNSYLHTFL